MVTWDVVTTAREPTSVLLAFVAHHLQQGASTIWLCLDAPDAEFEALVADKPRVKVINCDVAYWRNEHDSRRPRDFRIRQKANARWAYAHSKSDWIAHIDADEFMTNVPQLMEFLKAQPEEILTVTMWNAERAQIRGLPVRNVYGGLFRVPLENRRNALTTRVYGANVRYLNFGVAGYNNGKSISRVGKGLDMLLHYAVLPEGQEEQNIRATFDGFSLLHFDGFTRNHWVNKMLLKAPRGKLLKRKNKARINQIVDTWEAREDVPLQDEIFKATKMLSLRQIFLLLKARKLLPRTFNITQAVAKEFPGHKVDFSPAAIDQELVKLQAKGDVFGKAANLDTSDKEAEPA
nr:glycosyltransferase family 2 protein [Tritonibacter litoralis]